MSLLKQITGILADPAPEYAFEISETGIAYARIGSSIQLGFKPIPADVLNISPLRDNVLRPDPFATAISSLAPRDGKKRHAVLILPDYAARIAVLDFDKLPDVPQERDSLVRFRMKKSVPFDIDEAAIGYYAQHSPGKAKLDVVVAVVALEIIARYEAPFRSAGLQTGIVTTSALATAELERNTGITLLAKLSGRVLTLSVFRDSVLKMVRSVELAELNEAEALGVVFPTLAYVEDETASRPDRITLCGFAGVPGLEAADIAPKWQSEFGVPVTQLRSALAEPGQANSGIIGYLESVKTSKSDMKAEMAYA